MMTSKSDKSIQKADITRMAFNQGSLGMEFSWNYERQMHIAFAMMMNKILKKVYAGDEEGYRDALTRHVEFFNITPQLAPFVGGIVASMEEMKSCGEVDGEAISSIKTALIIGCMSKDMVWTTLNVELSKVGEEVTTLQSILDGIMPGLIGLGGTWMYFWLLKKKVNPIMLILGTMVLGIAGAYFGILAG